MKNNVYLIIYNNCVMFGAFDNNKNFYYYHKINYIKNIYNNESIDITFLNLLNHYNINANLTIIKKNIDYSE